MSKHINNDHLANVILLAAFNFLLVLGCRDTSGDLVSVQTGCVTPDGSKIALYSSVNPGDKFRLILDGKSGKVIWKDLASSDMLICADDSSIISVSNSGAKWVESGKEIVFSRNGEGEYTRFLGMLDKNTIIRVHRTFYHPKMKSDSKRRASSERTFTSFPTFLVDKVGENGTREINLSESDLDGVDKEAVIPYFLEDDQIILDGGQKILLIDLVSGKIKVVTGNFAEMEKANLLSKERSDKYDAKYDQGSSTQEDVVIYKGKGDNAKAVNQVKLRDLAPRVKVINIIDCCNNGLNFLYWENDKYIKLARINHITGELIWKSDSLMLTDQK